MHIVYAPTVHIVLLYCFNNNWLSGGSEPITFPHPWEYEGIHVLWHSWRRLKAFNDQSHLSFAPHSSFLRALVSVIMMDSIHCCFSLKGVPLIECLCFVSDGTLDDIYICFFCGGQVHSIKEGIVNSILHVIVSEIKCMLRKPKGVASSGRCHDMTLWWTTLQENLPNIKRIHL